MPKPYSHKWMYVCVEPEVKFVWWRRGRENRNEGEWATGGEGRTAAGVRIAAGVSGADGSTEDH